MTITTILLLAAVYTAASFVQGLTGFGMALIAVPILVLVFGPQNAVGMAVALGVTVGFLNFFLHRHHVEYRRVIPFAAATYPLVPVGAYFLETVDAGVVMATLGGAIILLTLFSLLAQSHFMTWMRTRVIGFGFAAMSGLFLGAFSTSGPPIVAYFYTSDHNRMRAKANTQFFFAATALAAVLTHLVAGNISGFTLARSLPFLPAVLLGTWLGAKLSGRLPTRVFRYATDAFLLALGSYLIVSNL